MEEVRKIRNAHSFVGLDPVGLPPLGELHAADSVDRDRGLEHLEPRREHEHVDLMLGAVKGSYAGRSDPLDRTGLEVDVVAVEGRQVVV